MGHRVWHILSQLALLQWLRSPAPATCQYSFAGSYYPSNLPAELPMWKWARDGRGVLSQLLGLTEVRWCAPEERAGRSEGSQSWESSLWRTPAGREKKKIKFKIWTSSLTGFLPWPECLALGAPLGSLLNLPEGSGDRVQWENWHSSSTLSFSDHHETAKIRAHKQSSFNQLQKKKMQISSTTTTKTPEFFWCNYGAYKHNFSFRLTVYIASGNSWDMNNLIEQNPSFT